MEIFQRREEISILIKLCVNKGFLFCREMSVQRCGINSEINWLKCLILSCKDGVRMLVNGDPI